MLGSISWATFKAYRTLGDQLALDSVAEDAMQDGNVKHYAPPTTGEILFCDTRKLPHLTLLDNEGARGYWRLLLYRIEIRKALDELCQQIKCPSVATMTDPSLTDLIADSQGVLDTHDKDLSKDLTDYRKLSHRLEWAGSSPLTKDDIKKLNSDSPNLLNRVLNVKKQLPPS